MAVASPPSLAFSDEPTRFDAMTNRPTLTSWRMCTRAVPGNMTIASDIYGRAAVNTEKQQGFAHSGEKEAPVDAIAYSAPLPLHHAWVMGLRTMAGLIDSIGKRAD